MDPSELEMLQQEATELFDAAENSLVAIDKGESFTSNYQNVFRAFHSLKGAAGMFGLEVLQKHLHHLEDLLGRHEKNGTFPPKLVSYFLEGIDCARSILSGKDVKFPLVDPLADSAEKSKPEPTIRKQNHSTENKSVGVVFVIDNNPETVTVFQKTFESFHPVIRGYKHAEDAIEGLKSERPDVIFCQFSLKGMSGLELVKSVRKVDSDLPVILLGDQENSKMSDEALNLGSYAFFEKPYNQSRLIRVCRNAIRKSQLTKLLDSSLRLMMYQFADLEDYLSKQGKKHIFESIKEELKKIIEQRKLMKEFYKDDEGNENV